MSATLTDGDGQPAPAGLLALSGDTVTVPAGGDASVQVTPTAVDGHPGNYRGILTGRNAEATVTTRTALSVYQEEEKYDLTVHLVNRHGAVPPPVNYASVIVVNTDDGGVYFPTAGQPFRLPRGRYAVHGVIEDGHTGYDPTYSFISWPGLTLDHDTTLTLDARDGRPASVRPDNPAARGGVHRIELLSRVAQCECTYAVFSAVDPRFSDIYAGTVPGTSSPDFGFAQIRRANEPLLELFAHGEQTFEVRADWFDQQPAHDEQATVPAGRVPPRTWPTSMRPASWWWSRFPPGWACPTWWPAPRRSRMPAPAWCWRSPRASRPVRRRWAASPSRHGRRCR